MATSKVSRPRSAAPGPGSYIGLAKWPGRNLTPVKKSAKKFKVVEVSKADDSTIDIIDSATLVSIGSDSFSEVTMPRVAKADVALSDVAKKIVVLKFLFRRERSTSCRLARENEGLVARLRLAEASVEDSRREVEAMSSEIDSLKKHLSNLEDLFAKGDEQRVPEDVESVNIVALFHAAQAESRRAKELEGEVRRLDAQLRRQTEINNGKDAAE